MVNVVPDSTISRIFRTRTSSTVGVNGRGGATADSAVLPSDVMAFVPFPRIEPTRASSVRTGPPADITVVFDHVPKSHKSRIDQKLSLTTGRTWAGSRHSRSRCARKL